jgi:hypothetical protein
MSRIFKIWPHFKFGVHTSLKTNDYIEFILIYSFIRFEVFIAVAMNNNVF